MIETEQPRPAVLALDGFEWRPAGARDAQALDALASLGNLRLLFGLPASEAEFAAAVGRGGFRQPMLCLSGELPIGAAATANHNRASLNLQLVCFFADPAEAELPLATYVRHVFWSSPMHRVYMQLPVIEGHERYADLAQKAGFELEGVVRRYALAGGKPCDVKVLGLLRSDLERWCAKNEPRLAL